MMKNNLFERHYQRLVLEGILKSSLLGLMIGFCANFLVALACWIFDFGGIWLTVGTFAASAVISGAALYFVKFRPNLNEVARRVDRLGLEERMVTMLELENDDSYIATLQRENARQHLSDVDERSIRLRLSRRVIVLTVVAAIVGSSMTTVAALAHNDIIPSGGEIINPEDPLENYVSVSYVIEEGGEVIGEADQLLLPGQDATTVVAIAEDGWAFVGWDDGVKTPDRTDKNITEDVVFTAVFQEVPEGDEDGDGDSSEAEDSTEGDQAPDAPQGGGSAGSNQPGGSQNNNQNDSTTDDDSSSDSSGGESGDGEGQGQGNGAGGKWEDRNQFIDGNTYYKDKLDMFYELAKQIFEENGEIPPEFIELFETYFGSI